MRTLLAVLLGVLLALGAGLTGAPASAAAATPNLTDDTGTVAWAGTVTINLGANDASLGDAPVTFYLDSSPALGTAEVNPSTGALAYTADFGETGTDTFTYAVQDADLEQDTATITVTVTEGPAILARDDTVSAYAGQETFLQVTFNDRSTGSLESVSVTSPPQHGTATVDDLYVSYIAASDYTGQDSFGYSVTDSNGNTALATVTIDVTQRPLSAASDNASTAVGVPVDINVLANDTIPVPSAAVSISSAPGHGTAVVQPDKRIRYTPAAGYVGPDSFTYLLSANGDSSTGSVNVDIRNQIASATGPLTKVWVDEDLNCAVNHISDTHGEFFGDTACGTFLVVDDVMYSPASIPAGQPGTAWTPVSQTLLTGNGTQANPFRYTTTVAAGTTGVTLTQIDSYVEGQESYRTDITVNNSSTARDVRLYRAGDCFLAESDSGLGSVNAQSGAVACVSPTSNRVEQWLPLSPGSRYYEAGYSEVWSKITAKEAFPNTCRCTDDIDNGAGLSWDLSLAASANATRSSLITFSPGGSVPLVTEKTVDDSTVAPGDVVTYQITVRNPGSTVATLSSILDTLPVGFSYVPGSTTGASTSNPVITGQTLTWATTATVPANGSTTLTFRATAPATLGTFHNNASATAVDLFVTPTGNTAPVTVEQPAADTTPPGPVSGLTATPGDGSVSLAWTNPTDADFAGVTVVYQAGDVPPATPNDGTPVIVSPATGTSVNVTGLVNGTLYSFSVFARDASSNHSDPASASATPEGVRPDPVTDLQAAGAGTGSAVLTWVNPTALDGIIVRYSDETAPTTPAEGTGIPVTGTPQSLTVDGLSDGTTYHFSVFATLGDEVSDVTSVTLSPFTCPNLAEALDAPALVTGSEWIACSGPDANDSASTLTTILPKTGTTQALMTSGDKAVAIPPSDGPEEGADNGTGSRGAYDVSIYRLDVTVPAGNNCLRFDYAFASDEYPEYVGSQFNDGFLAQLDQNEWVVSQDSAITATGNFARVSDGTFISVNGPVFATGATVHGPAANGTGYDGMSVALTASTPITPGGHSIYLSIFDAGDSILDSAAFIDNLRVSNEANCQVGTNRSPVADDDSATTNANTAVDVPVLVGDADPDGDQLSVTGHGAASHGTVTCDANSCIYAPTQGYSGSDSFSYTISDGRGGSSTANVAITVLAPPAVQSISIAVNDASLVWPQQVTVSGQVRNAADGSMSGVTVELWATPVGGTAAKIATKVSASNGMVSFVHRPSGGTSYQWRQSGGAVVSVLTAVSVQSAVTIVTRAVPFCVGDFITISGKASPVTVGTPVRLQRWSGTSWVTIASKTFGVGSSSLTPGAPYSFSVRSLTAGVVKYRVQVDGRAGRVNSWSAVKQVTFYSARITGVSKTRDEFVTVKNTGSVALNIGGWVLKNRAGRSVILPSKVIAPGATLKIHTGSGRNDLGNIYLAKSAMFGNLHDIAILIDRNLHQVSKYTY